MKKTLTKKEREAFSLIGRLGGLARYKKYGRKAMVDMGKKSGEKRRKNKLSPVISAKAL